MNNNQRMLLFIDLFLSILNENIQFKKTKSQPLLPYQALIVSNKFKSTCIKLVNHFDVIWDQGDPIKISSVYQKDKKRSQRIFDSFIDSLNCIREKLVSSKHQYKIFSVDINIVHDSDKTVKIHNNKKLSSENHKSNEDMDIDISINNIKQEQNIIRNQITQIKDEPVSMSPASPSPSHINIKESSATLSNDTSLISNNNNNVHVSSANLNNKSQSLGNLNGAASLPLLTGHQRNNMNQSNNSNQLNLNNNLMALQQLLGNGSNLNVLPTSTLPQLPITQLPQINMHNLSMPIPNISFQQPMGTNISNVQSQQTPNIPVHYIQNGKIGKSEMMKNMNLFGNIAINDFDHIERDDANNKVIGYKMERLNGDNGPIVIKQYTLFPGQ